MQTQQYAKTLNFEPSPGLLDPSIMIVYIQNRIRFTLQADADTQRVIEVYMSYVGIYI